jgi:hypothetical protein
MKLGNLIRILKIADPTIAVVNGFGEGYSYRGYYDQLAFEPAQNTTIGAMLESAESCVDRTFHAYKGGDYVMTLDSYIWLAEYGKHGLIIDTSMVMDWIESVSSKPEKLVAKEIGDSGIESLRELLQEYAEAVESDQYLDEDWPTYIYESAVTAFFGKTLWERKKQRKGNY